MSCPSGYQRFKVYTVTDGSHILSDLEADYESATMLVQKPVYMERWAESAGDHVMMHRFFFPAQDQVWRARRGYGFSNQVTVIIDINTVDLTRDQQRTYVVLSAQEVYDSAGDQVLGTYLICQDNNCLPALSRFEYNS